MTNEELTSRDIIPNSELKDEIDTFLKSMDFDTFDATPDLLNWIEMKRKMRKNWMKQIIIKTRATKFKKKKKQ